MTACIYVIYEFPVSPEVIHKGEHLFDLKSNLLFDPGTPIGINL